MVLTAGGVDGTTYLASAELYEPSTLTPAGLVSIAVSPIASRNSVITNFAKIRSHFALSWHMAQAQQRHRGYGANGWRCAIFLGPPMPFFGTFAARFAMLGASISRFIGGIRYA